MRSAAFVISRLAPLYCCFNSALSGFCAYRAEAPATAIRNIIVDFISRFSPCAWIMASLYFTRRAAAPCDEIHCNKQEDQKMAKYLCQASYTPEGMRGLIKDKASGRKAAVQ